jgi:lipopolysaccharide/colanic/teichoic acid biosynthesis glycosyltransferase
MVEETASPPTHMHVSGRGGRSAAQGYDPILDATPARVVRPAVTDRARRMVNVTAGALLLLLTAPLMLLIALLIRLTSRGPILYRQTRVGLDARRSRPQPDDPRRKYDLGGRPFTIYKFRTMRWNGDSAGDQVWARRDDPRVTLVGRVLRQYRLDELPQLFNVLRGDMNLVGPRPEQPRIVAELRQAIPEYQLRHKTLPGITGLAQVHLEYDSSLDDVRRKVEHDLEYLRRASAWEDLKIMLKTVPVMLFRRGAR